MSGLTKSEIKFLTKILKTKISDSERAIKSGESNFSSGRFPLYTKDVLDKHIEKNTAIINECEKIINKLNTK